MVVSDLGGRWRVLLAERSIEALGSIGRHVADAVSL
jgi:hypothetical protein